MLPEISYTLTRRRLEEEFPAYTRLILDRGRKEPSANIAYRKYVRELCRTNLDARATIMEICRRDPLYFANVFCNVEEPRRGQRSIIYPFITYEFQDAFLADVFACLGVCNHQTLKSRDTGWSFGIMGVVLPHQFCFADGPKYTVASSDKEMVESTENPDTLMAKFDFNMSRLPWWMVGEYTPTLSSHKQLYHRFNPTTRVVITGAATKSDISRGGRRTTIFPDEAATWGIKEGYEMMAAMVPATDSIIMGSTPKGNAGSFRDTWQDKHSAWFKAELKWEDHPRYREGMYCSTDGELEIIDDEFWGRDGSLWHRMVSNERVGFDRESYPFILDGLLRSPAIDDAWLRLNSPSLMAQEYYRDFIGSGDPFFNPALIKRLVEETARPPMSYGIVQYDKETCRPIRVDNIGDAIEAKGAVVHFWCPLNANGHPQPSHYVIGVDVAAGTGRSDSSITVANRRTGEKVALVKDAYISAHRLGELAVALCYLFHDEHHDPAYLIWDAGGTAGQTFRHRVVDELLFGNVYMRQVTDKLVAQITEKPGYSFSRASKAPFLTEYARALADGRFINRSEGGLLECLEYQYNERQEVEHSRQSRKDSPSGSRDNHGDEVISDALCWHAMQVIAAPAEEFTPEMPVNCLAARIEYAKNEEALANMSW